MQQTTNNEQKNCIFGTVSHVPISNYDDDKHDKLIIVISPLATITTRL